MDSLFAKLKNAPAAVFQDITPPAEKEASHGQENNAQGKIVPLTGEVSEQAALEGAKGAEIKPFSDVSGTGQAGTTGTQEPPKTNRVALGSLMEAGLTLELVDAALPALVVILLQATAGIKMQKRELQLTEKEKAVINPVLQNYLNSVNINFDNPLQALCWTVGVIYGSKFMEKGFGAWTDKKEAEDREQKRIEQIRRETKQTVAAVHERTPVVNLNENKDKPKDNETAGALHPSGWKNEIVAAERKAMKMKLGYSPSNDQISASLIKKKIAKG